MPNHLTPATDAHLAARLAAPTPGAAARHGPHHGHTCTHEPRQYNSKSPYEAKEKQTAAARLLPLSTSTDPSHQLAALFPFLRNPAKGLAIHAVCEVDGDGTVLSGCPTVPSASAWQALSTCATHVGCISYPTGSSTDNSTVTLDPTCVLGSCTDQWIAAASAICMPLSAPVLRNAGMHLTRLPFRTDLDSNATAAASLLAEHHAKVGVVVGTGNATMAKDQGGGELGVCVPTLPVGSACQPATTWSLSLAAPPNTTGDNQPLMPLAALLYPGSLPPSASQDSFPDSFPIMLRSVPTTSSAQYNVSSFMAMDNFYSLVRCDPSTLTLQPNLPPYTLPSTYSLTPRPLIDARPLQRTDTPGTIDAPAPKSPDWVVQLVLSIFLLVFLFGTYALKLYGPRILHLWLCLQRRATGGHTTTQRELVLKPASRQMLDDVGELRAGHVRERMSQARPGEVVDFRELGAGDVDEELGVVVLEGVDALPRYTAPSLRSSVVSVGSVDRRAQIDLALGQGMAPPYETLERGQAPVDGEEARV